MKRKELFWMLVPCLIFAVAGAYFMRREFVQQKETARAEQPFHWVIEKIEKRPIVAVDAADGYDSQIVVTLNHTGRNPQWWGTKGHGYGTNAGPAHLNFESGGKKRVCANKVMYHRPVWKPQSNRYEARFLFKLSDLPPLPEKTVLHANMNVEDFVNSRDVALSPPVMLIHTVRQPNQIVKAPLISHAPQVQLKKVTIAKMKGSAGPFDTQINAELFDLDEANSENDVSYNVRFTDERGQHLYSSVSFSSSQPLSQRRFKLTFNTNMADCNEGPNIFLVAKFSRHGHWPAELTIPLRRNGKDIVGKLDKPQFQIAPAKGY